MAKKAKDKNSLAGVIEALEKLNKNAGLAKIHEKKIEKLTAKRNQIAAKASGLSEKEVDRRFKHDQEIKKLQEKIEAAKEAGGDDAPEVRKNQKIMDKMKAREEARRAVNLRKSIQGLGDKLGKGFENLSEKARSGAGMLLKGVGVVALFAFLQSDAFKKVVGAIVDFVFQVVDLFSGSETQTFMEKAGTAAGLLAIGAFLFGGKIMTLAATLKGAFTSITNGLTAAKDKLFGEEGMFPNFNKKLGAYGKSLKKQMNVGLTKMKAGFGSIFGKGKKLGGALGKFTMGLLSSGKALAIKMLMALKGVLVSFGAMLVPLLPFIAIGAAIAAAAYAIVRIFQGFQESFSEANEQFGFFGGILAGFTQGIKNILLDVANVIDSILGFFGFPDAMDGIIKAIEDFDVMEFVGNVMDFFSELGDSISETFARIGRFFKAVGLGFVAGFKALAPGGEGPLEAFKRVFDETLAGGSDDTGGDNANALTQQNMMQNRIAGTQNLGTDLGALQAQQSELQRGRIAANIVNNSNVVQKGGDVYNERIETVSISDPNLSPFAQFV
tara:strand:+ start:218 stop:1876 length:1659 start_codon:yes stop_codon:yes gene_type:complete